jgi:rod shape-determining protein MreD
MRWITFFILLYVMTSLQFAQLGGFPHGSGATWPRIEYLPILAIFYALYAAEPAAPMCGLLCGLCYDIITPTEFFGSHAVPLALIAYCVVKVRLSIFREHFVSQFIITLLAILGFAVLDVAMRKIIGATLDGNSIWTHFGHLAANAIYSALVAPIFYWLFFRAQPLLGFSLQGSRGRMHESRR